MQRHMAYHVLGPTCTLLSTILPRTSSLNYQHFVQHPPVLHINICQLCLEYEGINAEIHPSTRAAPISGAAVELRVPRGAESAFPRLFRRASGELSAGEARAPCVFYLPE